MQTLTASTVVFKPKHLWLLTTCYSIIYIISNWYDPRLIQIFGFDSGGGILIYPLTFLLADSITEVYGYKHARRAIWCGFFFNLLFSIYGYAISFLPYPQTDIKSSYFDQVMLSDIRIVGASAISYLCAEPFNSFIMAKLKIKTKGRYMGIRFVLSTIIASSIDTTLFCLLAFYGSMSNKNLLAFVLFSWAIKSGIEIAGLPISIRLTSKLKKVEKLDMYDKNTNFNILNFDIDYKNKDNEFGKHSQE